MPSGPVAAPAGPLSQAEERLIRDALVEHRGNQSRAATQLGISRGALARRMRRLGIVPEGED